MGVRSVGLYLTWGTVVWLASCGGSGAANHQNGAGSAGEALEAGAAGQGAAEGGAADASAGAAGAGRDSGGADSANSGGAADVAGAGGADYLAAGAAGVSGSGGAGPEPLPGSETFTPDGIVEVRLTLPANVWTSLEEHGNNESYVGAAAAVSLNGGSAQTFAKLGVRHKGAYSLHHCWDDFGGVRSHLKDCAKISYKLKFDEYDRNGSFDGLTSLNLHAGSNDDTKLRELVAYQTFRDAGVDAPRATPARLYINGEFQGIFIAVEEVDDRYAVAHFSSGPGGNLYKEVWPNALLSDDELTAALETNKKPANISDIRAFAHDVAETTPEDFDADVARHVDLEQLLRYIAVDRELRNWDGITAFYSPLTPHNFYWYHHPGPRGRFQLIPWDLDNTLGAFDPYMYPEQWMMVAPVPDLNSKPLNCFPRTVWEPNSNVAITPPRCDKFLDLLMRNHWQELVSVGTALRAGALSPASMLAITTHYRARIADIVAEDPTLDAEAWAVAVDGFSDILSDAASDFDAFMAGGLIEETVAVDPDAPTQEELELPTLDEGLHVGGITNFEFDPAPAATVPVGVEAFGDPLAVFSPSWSTKNPLSGKADARLDFTFHQGPEAYDEWVNLGIFSGEVDVSAYERVVVWLASDIERQIRIRVMSPAYDDTFGGIWSEFGVEERVGPTPRPVTVPFNRLEYPSWARVWTDTQGFPGADAEALALVLSRFNGLMFVPAPTRDASGELLSKSETGYLRVDNIYFR